MLTHHKCPMSAYIAPVMQIFFSIFETAAAEELPEQ